jgi:hypothetical protein
MSPKNSTKDTQRTIAAWPLVAIGTAAIAAASFFAFPTWSAMPAAALPSPQSESDAGAKEAAKLAHEHDTWLHDAHDKAHRAGQAQALPAQF